MLWALESGIPTVLPPPRPKLQRAARGPLCVRFGESKALQPTPHILLRWWRVKGAYGGTLVPVCCRLCPQVCVPSSLTLKLQA